MANSRAAVEMPARQMGTAAQSTASRCLRLEGGLLSAHKHRENQMRKLDFHSNIELTAFTVLLAFDVRRTNSGKHSRNRGNNRAASRKKRQRVRGQTPGRTDHLPGISPSIQEKSCEIEPGVTGVQLPCGLEEQA